MNIIVIAAIWICAGMLGWSLKIRACGEITVSDFLMVPICAAAGPFALFITAIHFGDYVIWRRK